MCFSADPVQGLLKRMKKIKFTKQSTKEKEKALPEII